MNTLWFYAVANQCRTGMCDMTEIENLYKDGEPGDGTTGSRKAFNKKMVDHIFGKMPEEAIGIMNGNYAIQRMRKIAAQDEDDCCVEIKGRGSVFDRDMHDPASLREPSPPPSLSVCASDRPTGLWRLCGPRFLCVL